MDWRDARSIQRPLIRLERVVVVLAIHTPTAHIIYMHILYTLYTLKSSPNSRIRRVLLKRFRFHDKLSSSRIYNIYYIIIYIL